MIYPANVLHVSINRPVNDVYAYVANPTNLPAWAGGLSKSALTQEGDSWIANSPMGKVKIKFAPKNEFGIVDHDVTLPDGSTASNPLRVQANGSGAEVIFTVYRLPQVSDADLRQDCDSVRQDLQKLKSILETQASA